MDGWMRFSYLVGLPPISPVQNTPSSCAFKSYIHTPGTNQIAETHTSIQSNTVNPSNTQVNRLYAHWICHVQVERVNHLRLSSAYLRHRFEPNARAIDRRVRRQIEEQGHSPPAPHSPTHPPLSPLPSYLVTQANDLHTNNLPNPSLRAAGLELYVQ